MSLITAWGQGLVAFLQSHQARATPVCFVLAFGESPAFVSMVLPATVVLIALGGLAGHAGVALPHLLAAAALGAGLGDWLSSWIGRPFADRIVGLWPLSTHPEMLPRARAFVERRGA